jgi:hypothetical protein
MDARNPTASRVVASSDTHSLTTWLVPCGIMGAGWYRVWFSLSTPHASGAYSWSTIKGTDSAAVIAEHVAVLRKVGALPADLSICS